MRLGFIGAGRMGRPMVTRLVGAGHAVRVLGRSAAARSGLAADGFEVAGDIAEVAAGADAVLICVHTDEQVLDVAGPLLAALADGSAVVVHTTGRPGTVEAIAKKGQARGIQVIDAPVSGGPHDVAAARVTVFVGGAEEAVARLRPVLASYADPVLWVGPLGAGQRVKLVNNALFAAQLGLVSESVRLGAQLGLDEAVLLDALGHGSAASRALAGAAARGSIGTFVRAVDEFVRKDVHVVRAVAAEDGGDLGLLDAAIRATQLGI